METIILRFMNTDYLWWGIAAVLGLASVWLPVLLDLGATAERTLIIGHVGLLLSGVILGFFKPERPWRWSLGSVLLFPVAEFFGMVVQLPSASFAESLLYIVVKLPIYALQALSALLGAYLGAFAKLGVPTIRKPSRNARLWGLGAVLGLTAAGIPLEAVGPQLAFLVWICGLFLVSAIMGGIQPDRAWRWGIAVSISSSLAVILRIIVDILQQRASHNLWPIEIFVSLVVGVPTAFAGAYFGVLLKRIFRKNSREKTSDSR